MPADPQAGVRALDLARTLLPAQRRNWAPRAEQHEQPLQALDAERREQWLWSDGRTARWAHERAHEKALLGADLLPQPRDEDDVRVEAQWQEHVCRSNLVSGVSARVEGRGRGAESLCLLALGQGLGRAIGGVPCSSAVVSHKHT